MKVLKLFVTVLMWVSLTFFLVSTDHYYIDLLQSFTFHALLGYLMLTGLFALFRWRMLAASGLAISFLLAVHLLPHLNNGISGDYKLYGHSFRVAHFNVLATNTSYEKSIQDAKDTDADLISFQEVNMDWINELIKQLEVDYPYYAFVDGQLHGVAVFSRYPLDNMESYYWAEEPTLTGNVLVEGHKVHLITTHTLSPRSPERSRKRDQHLEGIAKYVKSIDGPVLAIGDFNTVPWSRQIVGVKEVANLKDSRKSLAPTFPSAYSLGIPIDYILHSDEIHCLRFDSVDTSGSDHKGIIGEYTISATGGQYDTI